MLRLDCSFSVAFAASLSSSSPLNTAGLPTRTSASPLFPPGDPTSSVDPHAVCARLILTLALWPQLPQRLLDISPRMPKRSIQTQCMDPPGSRPRPLPTRRAPAQSTGAPVTTGAKMPGFILFSFTSPPNPVQILRAKPSRSLSDQVPAPPSRSSPGPRLP